MTRLVQTERLELRLGSERDAAEIARFYRENRDHLQPWSPTFDLQAFTEAFWLEQVTRRQEDFDAGRSARAFIFPREPCDRVIGNLSLTEIQRGPAQSCLLGYSLAADAQGHGYMAEAVRGAVGYAFEQLRLHRVAASYMPRNRRSGAVLRRVGFTVEGYARDYLLIDGRWEDHVLTAITNPAWSP